MILLHTADGWLRPELKQGLPWAVIRTIGGQAAPLFLLLAGVGVGLTLSARGTSEAVTRVLVLRGLAIVLAGYALRLAMWWIDGTAIVEQVGIVGGAILALGYAAVYRALLVAESPRAGRTVLGYWAFGLFACALGIAYVHAHEPRALGLLLRVDVLHSIGLCVALLAWLARAVGARVGLFTLIGIAIALLTQPLSSYLPGSLPAALAGYIAPYAPAPGAPPAGRFPLFPWAAYAFVGAGLGLMLGAAARHGRAKTAAIEWAALGALLALVCCESVPATASLLVREPWLTSLVRVGYRVGLSLVLGGLCVGLSAPNVPLRRPLLALGKASLVVYCVHLEPAFGLMAEPVRKRLDFAAWALGLCLLVWMMTWLALRLQQHAKTAEKPQETAMQSAA